MSVILKSQEEIKTIAGGLIYHRDKFQDILDESAVFQAMKNRAGDRSEKDGACFEDLFLCWLLFRMWVANKVAYAVQYGDNVTIGEDLPEIEPCVVDLEYLSAELRSLNYNIYTNGGQYWLDHEWHDLFMLISDRIKEESGIVCAGAGR